MVELVHPGGTSENCLEDCFCGTIGERKMCMVPCRICHTYGIWDLQDCVWRVAKGCRDALKISFGMEI